MPAELQSPTATYGRLTRPSWFWAQRATSSTLAGMDLINASGSLFHFSFPSQMNSATTVGNTVKISTPTLSWERVGSNVNEGPAAIYRNGRTWIVYSASGCAGTGYKLGRLELTGSNPLSAGSWTKFGNPIFQTANGQYQPGHNGFFQSKSGNQTWNVYHANTNTPGACDGSRYTAVQPVDWNSDGTPNLGSPRPLSENIPEPV
ncbi:hypothetical protein AAF712_008073 [Marasmius tenuissimus]|uniref:Uncharacterized protein n=1 Tax=Marasmius tenuissimus TaxID=585030 RepID=A0ABR2ZV20_9AGAR